MKKKAILLFCFYNIAQCVSMEQAVREGMKGTCPAISKVMTRYFDDFLEAKSYPPLINPERKGVFEKLGAEIGAVINPRVRAVIAMAVEFDQQLDRMKAALEDGAASPGKAAAEISPGEVEGLAGFKEKQVQKARGESSYSPAPGFEKDSD